MIKKYLNYLKYIMEHKKNVFKICWNQGLYIHAFTHDLSKLSPKEFFAYANYFYGREEEKNEKSFQNAWDHHKEKSKHHWDYWDRIYTEDGNPLDGTLGCDHRPIEMPKKYINQMLCDWEAMAVKFGGSSKQYYIDNSHKMHLHYKTKMKIEELLGVYDTEKYFCSIDMKEICPEIKSVGGYLQGGYGLWILGENYQEIGNIYNFNLSTPYLGSDIIVNSIKINNNKEASDLLTEKFRRKVIKTCGNETFW